MKPIKNVFTIPSAAVFLVATALTAIGCGSGDDVSPEKAKEMKEGFSKGVDVDKLTPDQKEHMKAYMGGAAPSAPSAPKTGAN
jgi:hypothetical protein